MSDGYDPGDAAIPSVIEGRILLSQRDLSLALPINFMTVPGVSLSAACFGNLVIAEGKLSRCFSNLLAVGFRRFELDLYWDSGRSLWSFCPVAMPMGPDEGPPPSTSEKVSTSAASMTIGSMRILSGTDTSSATQDPSGGSTMSGSSSTASISSAPTPHSLPLQPMGSYDCSPKATLETFANQLHSYIIDTQNTLAAQLTYYIFNIHAVASAESPESPAPAPANLPSPDLLIGSVLGSNLSSYIYTPANLAANRANLNSSWFTVPERYRPVIDYYSVDIDKHQSWSTTDGWPSESFVEFSNLKRVLFQFGTVDPQMQSIDYSSDSDLLFPSGYITQPQTAVSINSSGGLTSGCFSRSPIPSISDANSSWATFPITNLTTTPTTANTSIPIPLLNLTSALTNCGISPHLNTTLSNTTADTNPLPYHAFTNSTLWSWAPGEPKNYTGTSPDSSLMRCAIASPAGPWSVGSCASKRFVACRATPFNWSISHYPVSLSYAASACPRGTAFAAPASALENAYLALAQRTAGRDYDGHGVLVAFNSLQVDGCWVVGGAEAQCPYDRVTMLEFSRAREIVVPSVAAVIILIVSALTVFSKVAGNRRVRKRTRTRRGPGRGANGFVYEGVPS